MFFTLITNSIQTHYGGFQTNIYASRVNAPALSDIDNDGDMDILAGADGTANKLIKFTNLGGGSYATSVNAATLLDGIKSTRLYDLDNDGASLPPTPAVSDLTNQFKRRYSFAVSASMARRVSSSLAFTIFEAPLPKNCWPKTFF